MCNKKQSPGTFPVPEPGSRKHERKLAGILPSMQRRDRARRFPLFAQSFPTTHNAVIMTATAIYRGRFAPSPTGPLHLGSLFCAMATYLDARAHDGVWLVRIEDIDPFRDVPGADAAILHTLAAYGLASDEPVVRQSERGELYEAALGTLLAQGRAFGCACTAHEIKVEDERLGLPRGIYPGTCRHGTGGRTVRSFRFLTDSRVISFNDRRCGPQSQNVEQVVGDFVLKRADGCWAYQLAVVVDDAAQGVTDVVRGEDLLTSTARQIALQRALGCATPRYLHIGLILGGDGEKLSKQRQAPAVPEEAPLGVLESLWPKFGFPALGADSLSHFWTTAVRLWRERCVSQPPASRDSRARVQETVDPPDA